MIYIVTGVDGQLGGRVAENMLKEVSGEQLIFTAPNLERIPAQKLDDWKNAGVSVRAADYNNKEQMVESFKGGDRIYIVSSIVNGPLRVQQHTNVIDAVYIAGVKHLTYTSFLGANREDYYQYVLPDHVYTERYILSRGLQWNVMRNNLYLENYLVAFAELSLAFGKKWRTNAGETKATFIAKDDSARVATALLLGKGENNKAYDVTGSPIDERELCKIVSENMGVDIEYVPLTDQEYLEWMDSIHIPRDTDGDFSKSPVPWCSRDMVTGESSVRDGMMAIVTDTVEKLTGNKPLSAYDLIDTYKDLWLSLKAKWLK